MLSPWTRVRLLGIATVWLAVPLAAQTEYRVYIADGWPSAAELEAIGRLDGVEEVSTILRSAAPSIKLRMRQGVVPSFDEVQKLLGRARIWSLRPADSMNPAADLARSAAWMREHGGMKKDDVEYMAQRDPRTKRRLLLLALLGQIRDACRGGTETPRQLAGNQKMLALLPLIDAHIDAVRARGYTVEYEPLPTDAGILHAIANAVTEIRDNDLGNGIEVASKDSRLRHMYSMDKDQKLIQRQIELAFKHYRVVMLGIADDAEAALRKLADRPETDPVRVQYQALRTTALGLQRVLR